MTPKSKHFSQGHDAHTHTLRARETHTHTLKEVVVEDHVFCVCVLNYLKQSERRSNIQRPSKSHKFLSLQRAALILTSYLVHFRRPCTRLRPSKPASFFVSFHFASTSMISNTPSLVCTFDSNTYPCALSFVEVTEHLFEQAATYLRALYLYNIIYIKCSCLLPRSSVPLSSSKTIQHMSQKVTIC